jgi:hypothetical protein
MALSRGARDAAGTINDVIGFAPERDDLSGCHADGDARQPSAESAIRVGGGEVLRDLA